MHDVEFKPIIDYVNGEVEPDWDEVFKREWKGIAMDTVDTFIDDFAVSGSTASQIIGQDMLDQLLESSPLFLGVNK